LEGATLFSKLDLKEVSHQIKNVGGRYSQTAFRIHEEVEPIFVGEEFYYSDF
jgi:hypothetical protein